MQLPTYELHKEAYLFNHSHMKRKFLCGYGLIHAKSKLQSYRTQCIVINWLISMSQIQSANSEILILTAVMVEDEKFLT